jgi:serine/threonine protein kinase
MTPTEFQQLQELFEEAVKLPPEQRPGYLDAVCPGKDGEMRSAVERLLKASGTGFVTGAVLSALQDASGIDAGVHQGTRLGGYRILRHLGSGGMAHVYLAERADDEFQMKVAIKVIQGGLGSESFEQRFRLERQILASLDHPNCCRLIDGGVTDERRPYLVMEYVDGEPITRYAANNHLGLRAKLELFRQLCAATEYVHSNLVIHRDIKPGNVLVTAKGLVKLMDFGIAKLLDPGVSSELTTRLERLATPGYASPEQLRGETITTASDVYSLGILLEELLTGSRRGGVEADNTRGFAKDLQAIVHRATHADPARRYRSTGQFTEDIGRFLGGYPVLAKPDSWGYRASKFVRRNRAAVIAAVVALMLLAGGLFSTIREQQRTKQRFDEVRDLATVFLFEFDASIQDLSGSTDARRKLVERALSTLETLSRDSQGDLTLQEDLAKAYHKVAIIQWTTGRPHLGDMRGAIGSVRKEIEIRERIAFQAPGNIRNRIDLASVYAYLSSPDFGDAKASREFGDLADKAFAELEQRFPDDPLVLAPAALSHSRIGLRLHRSGRLQESLSEHRRSIALMERLTAQHADNNGHQRLLGWFHIYAGDVLGGGGAELNLGDRKAALAEMRKGLEIFQAIVRRQPSSGVAARDVQSATIRIAGIQEVTKQFDDSIRTRREIIAQVDALWAEDQKSSESARDASIAHSSLGLTLTKADRLAEAEAELRRAEAIDNERLRRFPQDSRVPLDLANVEHNLANVFRRTRRAPEAVWRLRRSVALREPVLMANPSDSRLQWRQAKAYASLGEALEETHDWGGARTAFEHAVRIYAGLQANGHLGAEDQRLQAEHAKRIEVLKAK